MTTRTIKAYDDLNGITFGSTARIGEITGSTLLDNLVASWKLDDLTDATGRGNTLTNNGSATFSAGLIGNAVSLDPAFNQFLSIADNADISLGDQDMTIGLWAKWNTTGNRTLVSKYNDGVDADSEYDLFWHYSNDGRIRFSVWAAGPTIKTVASNSALSQDNWYCVIVYHDAANDLIGISINNDTPNTTATGGSLIASGVRDLRIGVSGPAGAPLGGNYFSGLIDDVNIWKRILTSDERAEFNNAGSGKEYPFT